MNTVCLSELVSPLGAGCLVHTRPSRTRTKMWQPMLRPVERSHCPSAAARPSMPHSFHRCRGHRGLASDRADPGDPYVTQSTWCTSSLTKIRRTTTGKNKQTHESTGGGRVRVLEGVALAQVAVPLARHARHHTSHRVVLLPAGGRGSSVPPTRPQGRRVVSHMYMYCC